MNMAPERPRPIPFSAIDRETEGSSFPLEEPLPLLASCPFTCADYPTPCTPEVERLRKKCRRLADLLQTDTLTGLFNFRFLLTILDRELERTRRTGLPTALIMIDLDHFKKSNDTYGHEEGNKAPAMGERHLARKHATHRHCLPVRRRGVRSCSSRDPTFAGRPDC